MKVLIDLNIFIDVLQKRQEFLKASLQIVKQALTGKLTGCLPAHSVTTGVYICSCHGNGTRKDDALSLILDKRIAVIPCDRKILLEARKLGFADYEDAVFYDILAEELARRDMDAEQLPQSDTEELARRIDEYYEEFEKNGIDNVKVEP